MGRRICLTGFSDFNRWFAMMQPDDVEIWCLNESHNCTAKLRMRDDLGREHDQRCGCLNPNVCTCKKHTHEFIPRYDRWFQIHPKNHREEERKTRLLKNNGRIHEKDLNAYGRNERHVRFLRECTKPLYMMDLDSKWGPFRTAIEYPLAEVEEELGISWGDRKNLYATSSPAYMIALALYEHMRGDTIDQISLAGVELALGTEYAVQRPCFEFYLGMAIGMGIEIVRPPQGCSLLAGPRYAVDDALVGYDEMDPYPMRMPNAAQMQELMTDVTQEEVVAD